MYVWRFQKPPLAKYYSKVISFSEFGVKRRGISLPSTSSLDYCTCREKSRMRGAFRLIRKHAIFLNVVTHRLMQRRHVLFIHPTLLRRFPLWPLWYHYVFSSDFQRYRSHRMMKSSNRAPNHDHTVKSCTTLASPTWCVACDRAPIQT